jgi:hypothetical protein
MENSRTTEQLPLGKETSNLVLNLDPSLASCVTLGKSYLSLYLKILIKKIRKIIASPQGDGICEHTLRRVYKLVLSSLISLCQIRNISNIKRKLLPENKETVSKSLSKYKLIIIL